MKKHTVDLVIDGQRQGVNYDALTRRLMPDDAYKQHISLAIASFWQHLHPDTIPLSVGEMVKMLAEEFDCSYASIVERAVSFQKGLQIK